MKPAIGMIETRGLVALFEAVDAMLKAASVTFRTWEPVGSGLVTAFVEGEVVSVLVIPRPHDDLEGLVGKLGPKAAAGLS